MQSWFFMLLKHVNKIALSLWVSGWLEVKHNLRYCYALSNKRGPEIMLSCCLNFLKRIFIKLQSCKTFNFAQSFLSTYTWVVATLVFSPPGTQFDGWSGVCILLGTINSMNKIGIDVTFESNLWLCTLIYGWYIDKVWLKSL